MSFYRQSSRERETRLTVQVLNSLREKLNTDQSVITVEFSPPKGTDVSQLIQRVLAIKGRVDGINIPDCQRSILKMSSLATAKIVQDQTGMETIWQLTCRDRNLLALQADILGAYALGLHNILALTGDPIQVGDHKEYAKQVFHLESTRLLELVHNLNEGRDATGKDLKQEGTQFTVGSALNPLKLSSPAQRNRLKIKLQRGVHFFQTQPVYDLEPIEEMNTILAECCKEVGCLVPKVLVGIVPPSSAKSARFMNTHVAGINIPESFIELLEKSKDPKRESILYCAEVIQRLKPVSPGFHFMPIAMETRVGELLEECFALA